MWQTRLGGRFTVDEQPIHSLTPPLAIDPSDRLFKCGAPGARCGPGFPTC